MATLGGPALLVSVQNGGQQQGGAAIPVTVVSDGRAVQGGPATPIYIASGGPQQAGPALPVVAAPYGTRVAGGDAVPAYIVGGGYLPSGYESKIIALGPIAFWPMDEASGTTAFDRSGNGRNGTYSNVTLGATGIGDGGTAASFNGTNSVNNVYSASLAGAFNGAAGTLMLWFKVSSAGVWTDGALRFMATLQADANNRCFLYKDSANNTWNLRRVAGGTNKQVAVSASPTDWTHAALTWDETAGQVKGYVNGVQSGATLAAIGTFAGALSNTNTLVGANGTGGASGWSGLLAQVAVFSRALSATEVASAASLI